MEEEEARQVLGVDDRAGSDEIRAAFRRQVRARHPDLAGVAGTNATVRILDAYRALRHVQPSERRRSPTAPPPTPESQSLVEVQGDTLLVRLALPFALAATLEVAHGLGHVAYLDRSAGLVEVIVEFIDWPVSSVVLAVEARSRLLTAVTVAAASLTRDPPPPDDGVAALVADRMRAVTKS